MVIHRNKRYTFIHFSGIGLYTVLTMSTFEIPKASRVCMQAAML